MKKYNAVIFDLDGTLMNTLGDLLDATNYMLEKYGYPLVDMEKLRKAVGNGALNQLRCCFPDTVTEEELLAYVEEYKPYYALHCEEKTAPYEGVAALLTELKERTNGFFTLKEGTLYPILYRLEDEGLIRSDWSAPEGRAAPKKIYTATQLGHSIQVQRREIWQKFTATVDTYLQKGSDDQ